VFVAGNEEIVGCVVRDFAARLQAVKIQRLNPRTVIHFLVTILFSLAETSPSGFAPVFAAYGIVHLRVKNGNCISSLLSSQSIHKRILYCGHQFKSKE
jgi:hypothetical protein